MSEEKTLINRVANSGLITINLENYYPETEIVTFDIKDYLWKEMILKEKEFRLALKEHDWSQYKGKIVCVVCSTDAIIPVWSYMLISSLVTNHGGISYGFDQETYIKVYYRNLIESLDVSSYEGKRIVIKGCSEKTVPPSAYLDIQMKLTGVAQSVMYGEPCSTVPIYKQPRKV
jgi:hypothetical protein